MTWDTSREKDMTTTETSFSASFNFSFHTDGVIRGLENYNQEGSVVVLQCIILFLLWASAVLGNVLVCLVIQRSRRVQSTTNYFVKSLALSDIVLVLITTPVICIRLGHGEWTMGHIACRLVRFSQLTSMACTSFVLMAICFDRFYTIIYPLSFKVTRGTAKRLIVLSWIFAAILSSLSIYFFEEVKVPQYPATNSNSVHHICLTFVPANLWTGKIYSCVLGFSYFLCPVLALTYGYFRILCYIHRTRLKVQIRRSSNVVPRNKVKMVKTLFILTTITLLLYSPHYIVQLFYCFNQRTYISANVFVLAYTLISLSATVKPVLYACRNSNFWRGVKEVLCMSGLKCYRLNTYTITTASRMGKKNFIGIMDLSQDQRNDGFHSSVDHVPRLDSKSFSPWDTNGALPCTSF